MSPLDRRSFIKSAAAGAGLLAGSRALPASAGTPLNLALPRLWPDPVPARTPIEHVVVLMMENRSVDHYLGWYGQENAAFDATQSRTYLDSAGTSLPTQDWGSGGRGDFSGCEFADPGHGHSEGSVQATSTGGSGEPDGFARDGSGNDAYALAYYQPTDIPVTAALTRQFTTFDRYFAAWLGSTYPNREYMHSGQTGGITNNDFPPQRIATNPEWAAGFDWPTVWTALDAKGVSWKYYYSNLPVIALWGLRHARNARHVSEYYADCAAGTLP